MQEAEKISESYYSETYDTSSIAVYEPTHELPNTLVYKILCVWGRLFLTNLKVHSSE